MGSKRLEFWGIRGFLGGVSGIGDIYPVLLNKNVAEYLNHLTRENSRNVGTDDGSEFIVLPPSVYFLTSKHELNLLPASV